MAAKDRTGVKIRARAKKLEKDEGLSPLIAEACAGHRRACGNRRGRRAHRGPLHDSDPEARSQTERIGPAEVRAARIKLKASQALLAKVMGVNTQTVSYWEQGRRKVPPMARHYLDDLIDFPALWAARTGAAVEAK